MVSSITKLVLIGAGLAIAAGLAYFTYQYTSSETLGGQLARSRFGLDEPPPIRSLLNKEADPSKPLSQQPKDAANRLVDEIDRLFKNTTYALEQQRQFIQNNFTNPNSRANAGFLYNSNNLSLEEEQTNDNSTFKLYEDPFYGIQIQSPSNWRINVGEAFSTVSFLPPARADSEADRPFLSVSIVPTHNWSSYLNLNEYLTSVTKGYDNIYFDVKVIESSTNSTLAGKPAFKLVFTKVGFDNINYKSMEIGTIIGNKAYSVTYTAEEKRYSDYLPTIQKMIDSFKITIPTTNSTSIVSNQTNGIANQTGEAVTTAAASMQNQTISNQTGGGAALANLTQMDFESITEDLTEARQAVQNNNNIEALRALNSLELQLLDLLISSSSIEETIKPLNQAYQAIEAVQNNNNIEALRALNSLELQLLDLRENQ